MVLNRALKWSTKAIMDPPYGASDKTASVSFQGTSVKYVRIQGGEGHGKAYVVREVSKGGCVNLRTRRR